MELRCTQRLTQTQKLELSQRLTLTQRILVQDHVLSLRLELIGSIREELYEPKGECPKCYKKLTPLEIIKGFNRNPTDFTTECPSCGYRFNPQMVCTSRGGTINLPFYCADQTLHHLKGYGNLPLDQLSRDHPGVFRSAIIHFGSLKRAFKEIGINYQFEEIDSSAEKIIPTKEIIKMGTI